MGLSKEMIKAGLDHVSALEPRLATAIAQSGYPEPRIRPEGYETLLRTIVGQQVSVASAAAVWNKLEARLGEGCPAEALIATEFDELRACGLSRQKQGYARSLGELILSGGLDLDNLPQDDEEAISLLTKVKGIGRWSAEIYLLFAQGRPDIWPAGDLAIQFPRAGRASVRKRHTRARRELVPSPWRCSDLHLAPLSCDGDVARNRPGGSTRRYR